MCAYARELDDVRTVCVYIVRTTYSRPFDTRARALPAETLQVNGEKMSERCAREPNGVARAFSAAAPPRPGLPTPNKSASQALYLV